MGWYIRVNKNHELCGVKYRCMSPELSCLRRSFLSPNPYTPHLTAPLHPRIPSHCMEYEGHLQIPLHTSPLHRSTLLYSIHKYMYLLTPSTPAHAAPQPQSYKADTPPFPPTNPPHTPNKTHGHTESQTGLAWPLDTGYICAAEQQVPSRPWCPCAPDGCGA